jgi:hypothetical protein
MPGRTGKATPQGWCYVTSSKDEDFYYKTSAIRTGGVIKVWIKSTKEDNDTTISMELNEINCQTYQSRSTQAVEYALDGRVLDSYVNNRPMWRDPVPGSIGETIVKRVCRNQPKTN